MEPITLFNISIIFILSILVLGVKNKSVTVVGLILISIIYAYFCSIRPLSSADTNTYAFYYYEASSVDSMNYGIGREYFPWVENWFINLCILANRMGLEFREFLFNTSLLFNVLTMWVLYEILRVIESTRNIVNIFLIVFVQFFINFGFLYSYVVIRGGLSFAMCLLAYLYYLKENRIKSAVSFLIAIALHNYSIICLLILLILKLKFKNSHIKLYFILFILFAFLNVLRIDVWFTNVLQGFSGLFSDTLLPVTHYILDAEQTESVKKGMLLYLIQNIYLSYLFYDSVDVKLNNYFMVLIVGSLIALLINDNAVIRITNYFFIFQTFLYARYFIETKIFINNKSSLLISRRQLVNLFVSIFLLPLLTLIYMLRYCSII